MTTKNVFLPNSVPFTLIDLKLCLKWSYKKLNLFPTNHVFDRRDRIVDCINKSFWQKSLALTIRSFCIQLEACSSNENGEKQQNVSGIFDNILSMDIRNSLNVLLLLIVSRSWSTFLSLCTPLWFKQFKQNVFIFPWTGQRSSRKSTVRKVDRLQPAEPSSRSPASKIKPSHLLKEDYQNFLSLNLSRGNQFYLKKFEIWYPLIDTI